MLKITFGIVASTLLFSSASAQTWSAEQQEILTVLDKTWEGIKNKEDWIEEFVHENTVYWDWDNFAPRTREQLSEWESFSSSDGTEYRVVTIRPLAVVVEGGTAVAHYYASIGLEDDEGIQTTSERRCSDILIRDDGDWKFFTWVCGPLPGAE